MSNQQLTYVLITPARNEEAFIERTIRCVTRQTLLPLRWVIVSDGSTDRTDEIVKDYAQRYHWIEYVRRPERSTRDFAAKVRCFNEGCARLKGLEYDAIGNLDADIAVGEDHFEFLLERFCADPSLGVTGTPFVESGQTYDFRFSSTEHVSGACQLFRRECFEAIGGYVPVKGGGIDDIAVITARLKGWRTRTFTERTVEHSRPMGTANGKGKLSAAFRQGQSAYKLGGHPLWQVSRGFYQMTRPPYVVGAGVLLFGYFWAMLRRQERPVSKEFIDFQRRDQMKRLRAFIGMKTAEPSIIRTDGPGS